MIPLFSLILVFAFMHIFTSRKSKIIKYYELFVLACVLRIYWFQGYFIKIGNNEFSSLAAIAELILTLYAVYLLATNVVKFNNTYTYSFIFFSIVNLLGIIIEIIYPYEGLLLPYQMGSDTSWDGLVAGKISMCNYYPTFSDYIKSYSLLLHFGLNVMLFKHLYDEKLFAYYYMRIVGFLKYGIYYGAFEFITKNIIGNLTLTYDLSTALLGMNELNVYKEAFMKNGLYTLQGLTREPSHFNCYLFTFVLLVILGNAIIKNDNEYLKFKTYDNASVYIAVLLLLFSGGFSAVWYLFILLGSYYIIKLSNKQINGCTLTLNKILSLFLSMVLIVAIACIIVQNDYLYNRLQDAVYVLGYILETDSIAVIGLLGGDEGIGSTVARFFSTYTGIMIFLDRPLFGLGYCLQFVHSLSALLLANMGIVGLYSIYKLLTCGMSKKYDILLVFFVFMIGGLPITTAPIGFSLQWILIFEATTFYKNKQKHNIVV